MERYTLKQLRSMVQYGAAIKLSGDESECKYELPNNEKHLMQIGYAADIYGKCTAMLFVGEITKQLYIAFGQAIYIYG